MGRLGLAVPPGLIISTDVCDLFYKNRQKLTIKRFIKSINRIETFWWTTDTI